MGMVTLSLKTLSEYGIAVLGQIALQNYDIERLVRESNEMKAQIEQLSSLRTSSLYKSSEINQQLGILI